MLDSLVPANLAAPVVDWDDVRRTTTGGVSALDKIWQGKKRGLLNPTCNNLLTRTHILRIRALQV